MMRFVYKRPWQIVPGDVLLMTVKNREHSAERNEVIGIVRGNPFLYNEYETIAVETKDAEGVLFTHFMHSHRHLVISEFDAQELDADTRAFAEVKDELIAARPRWFYEMQDANRTLD